jgi:hypothetical protein
VTSSPSEQLGSIAAGMQAGIGNVVAGSLFSAAQSIAMGGALAGFVTAAASAIGAICRRRRKCCSKHPLKRDHHRSHRGPKVSIRSQKDYLPRGRYYCTGSANNGDYPSCRFPTLHIFFLPLFPVPYQVPDVRPESTPTLTSTSHLRSSVRTRVLWSAMNVGLVNLANAGQKSRRV